MIPAAPRESGEDGGPAGPPDRASGPVSTDGFKALRQPQLPMRPRRIRGAASDSLPAPPFLISRETRMMKGQAALRYNGCDYEVGTSRKGVAGRWRFQPQNFEGWKNRLRVQRPAGIPDFNGGGKRRRETRENLDQRVLAQVSVSSGNRQERDPRGTGLEGLTRLGPPPIPLPPPVDPWWSGRGSVDQHGRVQKTPAHANRKCPARLESQSIPRNIMILRPAAGASRNFLPAGG